MALVRSLCSISLGKIWIEKSISERLRGIIKSNDYLINNQGIYSLTFYCKQLKAIMTSQYLSELQ